LLWPWQVIHHRIEHLIELVLGREDIKKKANVSR
jgi:hypothetical protein